MLNVFVAQLPTLLVVLGVISGAAFTFPPNEPDIFFQILFFALRLSAICILVKGVFHCFLIILSSLQ